MADVVVALLLWAFLGFFSARVASSFMDLNLGCVGGVEGNPVEVLVCQAAAWYGRKEGPKFVAVFFCHTAPAGHFSKLF